MNEKLPVAVGVPEILPVVSARVRPVGSEPPEIDHFMGVVPEASRSMDRERFKW